VRRILISAFFLAFFHRNYNLKQMSKNKNIEIEARFLNINKTTLIKKLKLLRAIDLGEKLLEKVIFYDKPLDLILNSP